MGSFSDNDDDESTDSRFFDAEESIESVSDSGPSFSDSDSGVQEWEPGNFEYDVWIRSPRSVRERRNKFLDWMGADLDRLSRNDAIDTCGDMDVWEGNDRVMEKSGAVLRSSIFEDEFSLSRSIVSWAAHHFDSMRELGNSGAKIECDVNDSECKLNRIQEVGSNSLETPHEVHNSTGVHPMPRRNSVRGFDGGENSVADALGLKNRLFRRLRSMTCMMPQPVDPDNNLKNGHIRTVGTKIQRVKVRNNRKRFKELSALFRGQNIQAHEGSILTMKFSLDGQYLASAGEDKIVRVWQVLEGEGANVIDIPDVDTSCLYFAVNHLSELAPLTADKEKMHKSMSLRKTSDSACIFFPPKVFRIREEPLHVFRGHNAEILDLSWSKNDCLLSSSVDNTVRLWKVGSDECLSVFQHSNYVTGVQFNPVNDDYFITGSIDGKVRIWEISTCRVVDWTDIVDIITAVCFHPNGEGGILGSMTGTCHFFSVADNRLQLEAPICLSSKKKPSCKRITGFQFFPKDSSKVLVTCADSQVRILSGKNVIRKFKGPRSSGNQISASFTSDGRRMITSSEDSNVYVWNSFDLYNFSPSQPKIVRSFECFLGDARIAVPWFGLKRGNSDDIQQLCEYDENLNGKMPFSPCFALGQEEFLESIPRGSATWPEEKLPDSGSQMVAPVMSKSQYKFLKTSFQSSSSSHAWGMVIVTAGWDGRIRSFHNYGLPVPQ